MSPSKHQCCCFFPPIVKRYYLNKFSQNSKGTIHLQPYGNIIKLCYFASVKSHQVVSHLHVKTIISQAGRWILEIYKGLTLPGCCQEADPYRPTLFIASKIHSAKWNVLTRFLMGLIRFNPRLAVINQIGCFNGMTALLTAKSVDSAATVDVTEPKKSC